MTRFEKSILIALGLLIAVSPVFAQVVGSYPTAGVAGAIGNVGPTGATGVIGATGVVGPTGAAGAASVWYQASCSGSSCTATVTSGAVCIANLTPGTGSDWGSTCFVNEIATSGTTVTITLIGTCTAGAGNAANVICNE